MQKLKYLSDNALIALRATIGDNLARYQTSDFADFSDHPAWDIGLDIEYDADLLATLDKNTPQMLAPVDFYNSKVVGKALSSLTPAMANEERIWVRLAHVEALEYCRARWLSGLEGDELQAAVETHMFASTQTGIRDDHALSRLWWNYHIAKTCMPNDVDTALSLISKTADIRSAFVERIWMSSRKSAASGVLRAMVSEPWLTGAEDNFRSFMKTLNRLGGGIVFEVLDEAEVDNFVGECVEIAKLRLAA